MLGSSSFRGSANFSMPSPRASAQPSIQPPSPAIITESRHDYFANGGESGRTSPSPSRASIALGQRNSFMPGASNRLTMASIDEGSRYKAMIKYLHSKISAHQWLENGSSSRPHGVLLRRGRGQYITEPAVVHPLLLQAITKLNVEVAFTMATETTEVIFSVLKPDETDIMLGDGSQLQIIDSLADIARSGSGLVRKFQYGALIREEQILLVWHDDLDKILSQASAIEERLLGLIWGTGASPFGFVNPSGTPAFTSPRGSIGGTPEEAKQVLEAVKAVDGSESDLEGQTLAKESLDRPVVFTSSIITGMGVFLIIFLIAGVETSHLFFESWTDHKYIRFALVGVEPIIMVFSVFFAICVVGDLFQVIGPIGSLRQNSRFYSAIKPDLQRCYAMGFQPPPITIQMPVYKEGLEGVIIPTVRSLKAAISHYESRGGTASIFINDDGMAFRDTEEAQERINFYHDNNIGWCSRPKPGDDGFVRKGKFKKASNMNFALNVSIKTERLLQKYIEEATTQEKGEVGWISAEEEEELYKRALGEVLAADSRAKADGNIRLGEIILIVDSDTRVPEDCLMYGAAEMFLSPEVAIIQHSTGVMQVQWDYFENGITYFTNLVYSAIRFAVGNGEVAPFVGHNAFLRWQAVQSVGKPQDDGYVPFWSEETVSEDFDMALRLQISGNTVRLGTYHKDEFKEGVSLTIYDELNRWEKYAYGCNELVFNPIWTWLWRGPFTRLFLTFMGSNMHISSKISILGYVSSYYAIASSFPLTIVNYFLVGWYNGDLDKFYMQSWNIFLSVVLIFNVVVNICLAIIRYRLEEKSLWAGLAENFKWMPMFAIFFGGLSFHLNLAILAHMFSIDMQWGATNKERTLTNFFEEMPKIFKRFKYLYLVLIPMTAAMIYFGCFAPRGWEINQIVAVVPMAVTLGCHYLLPFVLNPGLMVFNY